MIPKRQLKEGKAYLFKFGSDRVHAYVRIITIDGDRVNYVINDDRRFIWSAELTSFRKKLIRELSDKVDYRTEQEKEAFKIRTTEIIKDFLGENKNNYVNEITGKRGL